ncbi:hypothetical protein [Methylobrevis pamukkalensis]|uniref:Uncharacterized protein n=1 Tax=Methylobrevis pamukkalensis TaxID=1439726 RepID=A0A1E3H3M4_9HYPH|nr:hypothetical protein [Methylobrevis pamukkalensis]ODN70947.1 hypothetical protein A6302_01719 [Methylobrevis pamukkalensis]
MTLRYPVWLAILAIGAVLPAHAATEVPTQRIIVPPINAAPPVGEELEERPSLPPGGFNPLDRSPVEAEAVDPAAPLPEVHYGHAGLPEPVARMRAAILAAALTGDTEALRPVIESSKTAPKLAGQEAEDKIDTLKAESGDEDGIEILAILVDVLEAGWIVQDAGTPQETYVWPYFSAYPPSRLTTKQMVEVYRVMTAGDFAEIAATGSYTFYKVEITADGAWKTFAMPEFSVPE